MALDVVIAAAWVAIVFIPIHYGIYIGIRHERERIRKLLMSYVRITRLGRRK